MKIIKSSAEIINFTPDLEKTIELAARNCYKSEERIGEGTSDKIIKHILTNNHLSCIEHGAITVRFICDRGISHEIVRHRVASFSQESTRYCSYDKEKFGKEITVIDPRGSFWNSESVEDQIRFDIWYYAMEMIENAYFNLLNQGATPQEARSVLPNSLKTEIVMTANPREWRLIFELRTSKAAHPQIREIMIPLQKQFQEKWPAIFGTSE